MPEFRDLGLSNKLLQAIEDMGFQKPTPVQETVIPKELETSGDLVCLAQTGTGKTAAFGLPLLQKLDTAKSTTQVLILCPTRELCKQISQDITHYAKYMENVTVVPVYGGSSIEQQIRQLKQSSQIIVATPGRMVDLLERGVANTQQINTLILDEADEMLNMGFQEELDAILSHCPTERRTLLFSATLPIEVEGIARKYMREAEIVTIGRRNEGAQNVKHYYYVVLSKDRYSALKRIADFNPDIYGIVFCRTRQETQDVADSLIRDGYNADSLHGDLSQAQRELVMKRFKNRRISLLVATDVAARGIDVSDLTHVINYNLPDEVELYTHRSGRTGRADKSGISIAIINPKEKGKIKQIEKMIGKEFSQAKVPTGKEVCTKKLFQLAAQIENAQPHDELAEYMHVIESKWSYLSKEEIIQKVLSVGFNRFLDYYRNAPDLNVVENKREKRKIPAEMLSAKNEDGKGVGFSCIRLNIGKKQGIDARNILRLMNSCGLSKKHVGFIDISKRNTLIEVSAKSAKFLFETLNGSEYKGRELCVEIVTDLSQESDKNNKIEKKKEKQYSTKPKNN